MKHRLGHRLHLNAATSSSSRVKHRHWISKVRVTETLTAKGIQSRKIVAAETVQAALLPIITDDDMVSDLDWEMAEDVLGGNVEAPLSHAGGELEALLEDWEMEMQKKRQGKRSRDWRTRQDRVLHQIELFWPQLDAISDAYMEWCTRGGKDGFEHWDMPSVPLESASQLTINVIDVFAARIQKIAIGSNDCFISCSLIRQGLLPCSPVQPTMAISIRTIEVFRVASLYSPRFTLQAFAKVLCEFHAIPFKPHFTRQLSVALDLYLAVRRIVEQRVKNALQRDGPDWRLRNCCPACTYRLEGEEKLTFSLLFNMDGNDSLKHIRGRGPEVENPAESIPVIAPLNERPDTRSCGEEYFVSRESVHAFGSRSEDEQLAYDESLAYNPCAPRWRNMVNEATAKMWGIFDETGVFLSLCCHGFVMLVADMVRSGERAKYPLAIVKSLLNVFGSDLGGGYDIGCKFASTLDHSKIGPLAQALNYRSLVGAFHGHAHNRRCQLTNLATYVTGLGLEDLEGCERFFSKSNSLAAAVRHASVFHRRQAISEYLKHIDTFETYASLSSFLVNNYKQALAILARKPALDQAMMDLHITDGSVFDKWLSEEQIYLEDLLSEPITETLEMEYFQKLVKLQGLENKVEAIRQIWINTTPEIMSQNSKRDRTLVQETERRHALEEQDNVLKAVHDLEKKMGIVERWRPGSPKWVAMSAMVAMRTYQRCLDNLEGLVVARMFELTKMNQSQTGYKMRKHIAKALCAQSQAISTAIDRYNTAAQALNPPRPPIQWENVVQYEFLTEFDLLRDTRQDIRTKAWATPAGRLAMDLHFKILRAQEEIDRLNIEIRRFITYLQDEDQYLRAKEEGLQVSDPALAHQIGLYRTERSRFTTLHFGRLQRLSGLPGFTGSIEPGVALTPSRAGVSSIQAHTVLPTPDNDTDDDEDSDSDDEEVEQMREALIHILSISD